MAKKIVWTETAVLDRLEIYRFWLLHNKSDVFSEKLEQLFNESARLIAQFPEIGTQTDFPGVRVKVIKSYKLFYKDQSETIQIIRVWDTRQDPEQLETQ